MSLITISRGTFSGGRELAVRLAHQLGYQYLSQEDLSERASEKAVPVETLRDAVLRPPREYENITVERDLYLACLTIQFCEHVLAGDLVYFGHLGHMLLPKVPNILRVRALADMEYRLKAVMENMGCGRHEAKEHIQWVDTTRDKWVKFLYGIDWHDPLQYDIIINLARTGMDAAVSAIRSLTERREFMFSDHAAHAVRDMHMAARAHFTLLAHKQTRCPDIHVTANDGTVNIVFHPRYSDSAGHAGDLLSGLEGIHDINVVIAHGALLYVMESCDSETVTYEDILRVTTRLDSGVELMIVPPDGGVPSPVGDSRFGRCLEDLRDKHRFAGWSAFYGTHDNLVTSLQRRTPYRLIVLGNLFARKAPDVRTRLKEQLENRLADNISIPVVDNSELHSYLLSEHRHLLGVIGGGLSAVLLIVLLFLFQGAVLPLLGPSDTSLQRLLTVLIVFAATPLFAFVFGSFTRNLLRILGLG